MALHGESQILNIMIKPSWKFDQVKNYEREEQGIRLRAAQTNFSEQFMCCINSHAEVYVSRTSLKHLFMPGVPHPQSLIFPLPMRWNHSLLREQEVRLVNVSQFPSLCSRFLTLRPLCWDFPVSAIFYYGINEVFKQLLWIQDSEGQVESKLLLVLPRDGQVKWKVLFYCLQECWRKSQGADNS